MEGKEIVQYAENLTEKDLEWKFLYPNNIESNGVDGLYSFLWIRNEDGTYSGRKYTILFQRKEDENGCVKREEIEFFILFEKLYTGLDKPIEYPALSETSIWASEEPFDYLDINSYGSFVRAFTGLENAQKRALKQFKMVYAYALSHIITTEEEEKRK